MIDYKEYHKSYLKKHDEVAHGIDKSFYKNSYPLALTVANEFLIGEAKDLIDNVTEEVVIEEVGDYYFVKKILLNTNTVTLELMDGESFQFQKASQLLIPKLKNDEISQEEIGGFYNFFYNMFKKNECHYNAGYRFFNIFTGEKGLAKNRIVDAKICTALLKGFIDDVYDHSWVEMQLKNDSQIYCLDLGRDLAMKKEEFYDFFQPVSAVNVVSHEELEAFRNKTEQHREMDSLLIMFFDSHFIEQKSESQLIQVHKDVILNK